MSEASKIYIRLLEGPETLVPISARLLEGNTFEILDNPYLDLDEDVTSIWEFFPGDIVSCEKRGNDLRAKELLSSTFPDRRLYQIIFLIVSTLGNASVEDLKDFETEIGRLCTDSKILQRNHPVVQRWLLQNCSKMGLTVTS